MRVREWVSSTLESLATPIRELRSNRIRALVRLFAGPSAELADEDLIHHSQLERLNAVWNDACRFVPRFNSMHQKGLVPKEFESLDEFRDVVPIMTRDELRNSIEHFCNSNCPRAQLRSTGGSTAEPIRFPVCRAEIKMTANAAWLARSWIGIDPADRLFLLWGHSHLFGTGWKGWINRKKRGYSDRLLGYCRYSAYDMSELALKAAGERLIKFRPKWCLGYSVAWDRFADVNWEKRERIRELGIKIVIATAEAFPKPESREKIAELFGCPVLMEYGTVETGLLAQECEPHCYTVLWQNHILEVVENSEIPGKMDVVVTSLFPRCMPLIRYRIGDQISGELESPFLTRFAAIGGRCNDFLELRCGKRIHSEAISHILRDLPEVRSFQAVQGETGFDRLNLLLRGELTDELSRTIRQRLSKLDVSVANISIEKVTELQRSVAGKTPTVLRDR